MCTVSAIPLGVSGFRLVCNRDELRTRPLALPPTIRRFGDRTAALPVDFPSCGTWIAVSDAGLVMALLNANPQRRLQLDDIASRQSRGRIIPALLHCDEVEQALELARDIDPYDFQPFRLIVLNESTCIEIASNGFDLMSASRAFDGAPLMFTSSGLGDQLVEHPRRELFDRMVRSAALSPARQDAFHAHQWPDRPQISVMMERADARTVSRTIVEVRNDAASLRYIAGDDEHVARLRIQHLQTL